jgi:hypothetical protein
MPNATPVFVEQSVVEFALGHPGLGPARIAGELARPKRARLERLERENAELRMGR